MAKEQNLNGKKVDLSIIKIGAQDEKINTMKYILQYTLKPIVLIR